MRWAVLIVLIVLAVPAHAQQDRDTAVKVAEEALDAFNAGEWTTAFTKFETAHRLVPAITFVVYMARAKRNLGELLASAALYNEALAAPVAADAPPAFHRALSDATEELTALNQRIPKLQVKVSGPAGDTAVRITVDGRVVQGVVALDPGRHSVTASADGYRSAVQTVMLEAGQGTKVLAVTLEPLQIIAPAPAPAPEPSGALPSTSEGMIWPAFVGFGVAGVGLVLGSVMAAMASSKVNEIEEACGGTVCPSSKRSEVDDAGVLADVATVGFVVAGVGMAAGVALLIWQPSAGNDTAVFVGPTGINVRGTF